MPPFRIMWTYTTRRLYLRSRFPLPRWRRDLSTSVIGRFVRLGSLARARPVALKVRFILKPAVIPSDMSGRITQSGIVNGMEPELEDRSRRIPTRLLLVRGIGRCPRSACSSVRGHSTRCGPDGVVHRMDRADRLVAVGLRVHRSRADRPCRHSRTIEAACLGSGVIRIQRPRRSASGAQRALRGAGGLSRGARRTPARTACGCRCGGEPSAFGEVGRRLRRGRRPAPVFRSLAMVVAKDRRRRLGPFDLDRSRCSLGIVDDPGAHPKFPRCTHGCTRRFEEHGHRVARLLLMRLLPAVQAASSASGNQSASLMASGSCLGPA